MTEAIRAVIVDDEPLARDGIRVLLERDEDVEVVGECASGAEAAEAIAELEPDLLFLDVQMPELDGFEVLREAETDRVPFIIFVTAYDEYAIRAFDVHAVDYLLKPYDDERFFDALDRAKTELRHRRDSEFAERVAELLRHRGTAEDGEAGAESAAESEEEEGYLDRLVVKKAGRVYFVDVGDIDWIEAADYYIRLHVGDKSHLLRTTMKEMEASLDPDRFFRIHRSSIVRLDFVQELQPYFHGEYVVVLEDGTKLSLSRSRRKKLERMLGQRL